MIDDLEQRFLDTAEDIYEEDRHMIRDTAFKIGDNEPRFSFKIVRGGAPEGFVASIEVTNSYSIKDTCKSAGLSWDPDERVWSKLVHRETKKQAEEWIDGIAKQLEAAGAVEA